MRSGGVKPQRLAATLRNAAAGGACGAVRSVLEAALLDLLGSFDGPAPRGLAAECAHRCGAGGGIPEVAAAAAQKGCTRLVREVPLRDTLAAGRGGGAAAPGTGTVPPVRALR